MAGSYSATFPFSARTTIPTATSRGFRLKPLPAISVSASFPSNRTKRKNHLRPKILKTLTKPFPTAPLPHIFLVENIPVPNPISFPSANDAVCKEIPSESVPPVEADNFLEEFPASETIAAVGEPSGIVSKISAKSVIKYGGYLVGIFLFQNFFVWLVGNTNSLEKEERRIDFRGKVNILPNGSNVAYFDETELEEKISEIRAMAREAREKEKTERKEGNEESEIEKEIGARLAKLEKRLNSKREKLPESFMNYLGLFGNEKEEDGIGENNLELKEDKKPLSFKKKLKFKNPSMNSRSSPKGFSGSRSSGRSRSEDGSFQNGESRQIDPGTMNMDSRREDISTQLNSSQIDVSKLQKENQDFTKEIQSGSAQDAREERLSSEETKSQKSRDFGRHNSQSLRTQNQRTATKFDAPASSSSNDSRNPGKRQVENRGIHICRRSEDERPEALYTLRTPSQAYNQEESFCVVAFEDHFDANHFCYLLECYFEDLGEFSVDVVPLSTKELHDAVRSNSQKLIVVRKGQLKLYAGQPFAEVEKALYSLLE
ncbi:hypothetical protein JCGZ_18878 [Jatropha curcas]|uniref:Uncharacterized protein n=1 Tax=Jatropha curcas TaxID=180498 RepID=A0A067JYE6_JATCU|nr:hypothetical protein JCGZ_18878 [Jatropha curcas]